MKTAITVFTAMILITACKKTGTAKEMTVSAIPAIYMETSWQKIPANPANKYDTMGQRHNDILIFLRTHVDGVRHPDFKTITGFIIDYAADRMNIYLPYSFFSGVPATITDERNGYANSIRSIPYSDTVRTSLLELINIVRTICADKEATYEHIKAAIIQFENGIIDSPVLPFEDKRKILETASVARYSAYYWLELDPRGKDLKDAKLLWWIAAITSDVAGAMVSGSSVYAADCSEYAFDLLTYSLP